jgi:hypothetical protein
MAGWVSGKKDFFGVGARHDDSGGGLEAWIKPCLVRGLDNGMTTPAGCSVCGPLAVTLGGVLRWGELGRGGYGLV